MIVCPSCDQSTPQYPCVCGYAPPGHVKTAVRSTYRLEPTGITRGQFGKILYDAVFCCGALLAIQDQCNGSVYQRKDLGELLKKREVIKKELIGHMQQLDADDCGALVQRYPFLGTI